MRMIFRTGIRLFAAGILGLSLSCSLAAAASETAASEAPASGSVQVFYVSPSGDDGADGSKTAPFRTFAHALTKLSAGSTLFVQEGTYHERIVLPESLQGKSQGYICIAASPENSRPALLSGSGFTDDFCILSVEGASYIRISGLTFTDSYGLDAAGILIYPPSHHITVEQCTLTNLRVPEPAVQDHVANGISCFGDSAEAAITDILISGNSFSDMATGWGECISVTGNCAYIQIEENVVRNTGNIGIDVGGTDATCATLVGFKVPTATPPTESMPTAASTFRLSTTL